MQNMTKNMQNNMQNMQKICQKICKPVLHMQNSDKSIICIFCIYIHSPLCWWRRTSTVTDRLGYCLSLVSKTWTRPVVKWFWPAGGPGFKMVPLAGHWHTWSRDATLMMYCAYFSFLHKGARPGPASRFNQPVPEPRWKCCFKCKMKGSHLKLTQKRL